MILQIGLTPEEFDISLAGMRRQFHPDDFPAYTFAEDGTPTRTAAPKTGPYAGTANRPVTPFIRKSDGRECFNLTRQDGAIRIVSRNLILDALNPFRDLPDPPEPDPLPAGFHVIPGFEDYAFNPVTREVLKFLDPSLGPVSPPRRLKLSTVWTECPETRKMYSYQYFSMLDSDPESGKRHRVSLNKLLEIFGWELSDVVSMSDQTPES